jgi:N-formylglutamate deformylase
MTQCSYMQESMPFDYLPERAERTQPTLRAMLEAVLAYAQRT